MSAVEEIDRMRDFAVNVRAYRCAQGQEIRSCDRSILLRSNTQYVLAKVSECCIDLGKICVAGQLYWLRGHLRGRLAVLFTVGAGHWSKTGAVIAVIRARGGALQ